MSTCNNLNEKQKRWIEQRREQIASRLRQEVECSSNSGDLQRFSVESPVLDLLSLYGFVDDGLAEFFGNGCTTSGVPENKRELISMAKELHSHFLATLNHLTELAVDVGVKLHALGAEIEKEDNDGDHES